MKPYPFVGLNHFTVPTGIRLLRKRQRRKTAPAARNFNNRVRGDGQSATTARRRSARTDRRIVEPSLWPAGGERQTGFGRDLAAAGSRRLTGLADAAPNAGRMPTRAALLLFASLALARCAVSALPCHRTAYV